MAQGFSWLPLLHLASFSRSNFPISTAAVRLETPFARAFGGCESLSSSGQHEPLISEHEQKLRKVLDTYFQFSIHPSALSCWLCLVGDLLRPNYVDQSSIILRGFPQHWRPWMWRLPNADPRRPIMYWSRRFNVQSCSDSRALLENFVNDATLKLTPTGPPHLSRKNREKPRFILCCCHPGDIRTPQVTHLGWNLWKQFLEVPNPAGYLSNLVLAFFIYPDAGCCHQS